MGRSFCGVQQPSHLWKFVSRALRAPARAAASELGFPAPKRSDNSFSLSRISRPDKILDTHQLASPLGNLDALGCKYLVVPPIKPTACDSSCCDLSLYSYASSLVGQIFKFCFFDLKLRLQSPRLTRSPVPPPGILNNVFFDVPFSLQPELPHCHSGFRKLDF